MSWQDARYAVLDLETTGLDPRRDHVVSVGLVEVVAGRVDLSGCFYHVVRPQKLPGRDSVVIHGILPRDAAGGSDPALVGSELARRLDGLVPVAHVARIEREFLRGWLPRSAWTPRSQFVDTDVLARMWVEQEFGRQIRGHIALGEAARLAGLPEYQRHHALGDAVTTAQLLIFLAKRLRAPSSDWLARRSRQRCVVRSR